MAQLPGGPPLSPARRGATWAVLVLSLPVLVAGLLLPQGLLLAAGLVMSGTAAAVLRFP
ncbi:hypothetical protein [Streptomyces sp. CRN 30]|uniref:hypothetical protein n=1 Tax=Streptomyces sp. CRN 30 TaxID=3075613 RepID=UPI002A830657|nr:hypothetical protein [Streptomyces sp. CRN 30]